MDGDVTPRSVGELRNLNSVMMGDPPLFGCIGVLVCVAVTVTGAERSPFPPFTRLGVGVGVDMTKGGGDSKRRAMRW